MKSVLAFWVRSRTRSSCAARCKAPSRNGIKHSPNSSLRGIPCPLIGVHFRAYRLGPCSEIEIEEALHGTQQRQNLVGRFGGRRGLERVGVFYLPLHHRPAPPPGRHRGRDCWIAAPPHTSEVDFLVPGNDRRISPLRHA